MRPGFGQGRRSIFTQSGEYMDREKEESVFRRRIQDLMSLAERRNCILYSDFLNLYEQNILYETSQKFSLFGGKTFGGYEEAERKMAAFIPPDMALEPDWPIACIRIEPLNRKFAEKLSHRDILGALMNLGIDRAKTGDIAVGEQEAFLFCCDSLARMICGELERIRHTAVRCTVCESGSFSYTPATERIRGSVASIRLDAVMALAFGASRSSLISLIERGSVFVNGRLTTSNACVLRDGDIVSVRGHGRFRYCGAAGQSRKGRTWIELEKYI